MSRWSPLQRIRPTSRLLDILYYAISFAKLPFLHWCYKVLSWSPYTKSCLPVEINWQTEPQWHTANALLLRAHIGKVNTISIPHADFLFWKKNNMGRTQKRPPVHGSVGRTDTKPSKVSREYMLLNASQEAGCERTGRGRSFTLSYASSLEMYCKTLHP